MTFSERPVDAPRPQLFEQSSQYRHWKFSAGELRNLRAKVNKEGAERVREAFAEQQALTGKTDGVVEVDCLTWEEQLAYVGFFEAKLLSYCKFFRLDQTVQATAIAYFKRFYLYHTVMDYDPKLYLMACVFLSTKVENSPIGLETFLGKIPKSPPRETLVELEFSLSQGIRFEFQVHHPYWPLHGYYLDMQQWIVKERPPPAHEHLLGKVQKCYLRAEHFASLAIQSDLIFTHMPQQVGLGCLFVAAKENVFRDELNRYLQTRLHADPDGLAKLWLALDDIAEVIQSLKGSTPIDKEAAAVIDKKLRACRNPLYDPESPLYKLRRQQEDGQHEERLKRKIQLQEERRRESTNVFL